MNNIQAVLQKNFKGRNLSELSRELDMPRSILQDWINEKRLPSLKNLKYIQRIASYLNISLDELLTGESGSNLSCKTITSIEFEDNNRKYQVQIHRMVLSTFLCKFFPTSKPRQGLLKRNRMLLPVNFHSQTYHC